MTDPFDEYGWFSGLALPAAPARKRSRYGAPTVAQGPAAQGFRCVSCGSHIHTLNWLSGVQNRNHCPYCLWSKHLDLHTPGDRLAACKERMRPIGLALKRRRKKYGDAWGELMLAHECLGCGRVSLNRIAADDDAEALMRAFSASLALDDAFRRALEESGVRLLHREDAAAVRRRLFGLAE
jgi:hypothetical protein